MGTLKNNKKTDLKKTKKPNLKNNKKIIKTIQMESKQPTMDELLNRHELAFSTRFASLLSQLADEGIGFSLPVVVIEHI